MRDLMNVDLLSLAFPAAMLLAIVIGLVLWFFVHRASSRANEQVELLEALLEQQKRQNALLRRLCEVSESRHKDEPVHEPEKPQRDDEDDLIRLVAER